MEDQKEVVAAAGAMLAEACKPAIPRGRVKVWHEDKGFGFITPLDGGIDIFVHFTALPGNKYRNLAVGQVVEYDLGPSPRHNRQQAINVRVIA